MQVVHFILFILKTNIDWYLVLQLVPWVKFQYSKYHCNKNSIKLHQQNLSCLSNQPDRVNSEESILGNSQQLFVLADKTTVLKTAISVGLFLNQA